jgi:hypothetical protein
VGCGRDGKELRGKERPEIKIKGIKEWSNEAD